MIDFNKIKILKGYSKRLFLLMILGVLGSLLEVISLSSIGSLIYALLNDIEIVKNRASAFIGLSFLKNLSNTDFLTTIIIAIFLLFLFKNFFKIISHYLEVQCFQKIYADASFLLFKKYINLDLVKFTQTNFDKILNDISIETKRAIKYLKEFLTIFKDVVLIIFLISTLLLINWKVTVVSFLIISVLLIIYNFLFRNKSEYYGKVVSKYQEKQFKITLEPFQFFKFLAISLKKKFFTENFLEVTKIKNRFELKQSMLLRYPASYFELSFLVILLVISYILFKNSNNINQVISTMGIFALFSVRMLGSFNAIYNSYQVMKFNKNSLVNIEKKLSQLKVTKKKKIKRIKLNQLKLKNVYFKYPNTKDYVIKNFNLKIEKNKVIGIFGPTGCGKSTLLDLILGLIKPSKGQLYLNGKKISLYKFQIRNFFSYVPQKSYIFNDTIKKNILFGDENNKINSERITKILKKAEMIKFIDKLPIGINTICRDSGKNFSGGQGQRIAIARSLYLDHEVLILDEATSALDEKTEEKIFKNLKKDISQAIIFVSHNKKLIKYCDYFYDFSKIKN